MNQYTTISGRVLLSNIPLDYALEDGKIQPQKIYAEHIKHIMEAPNATMAQYIQTASLLVPAVSAPSRRPNIKRSLTNAAIEAAQAHHQCLTAQQCDPHCITPYPHIYSTDKKRYAVSQHRLYYASTENPAVICEADLTADDLAATCYVTSFGLATFLAKATSGSIFHGPDMAGHSSDHSMHHNTFVLSDAAECLVRDGDHYLPLEHIISGEEDLSMRIYLSACMYQTAICRLYLAMAQPVAG